MPTSASRVCIYTAAGPTVASGYLAVAKNLVMLHGALTVNGTLQTQTDNIKNSDLDGAGNMHATYRPNVLSGVLVSGSLRIGVVRPLLTGHRSMCGAELTLCLNDASRVEIEDVVSLDGGVDIGGSTTASTALDGDLSVTTSAQANRIRVPFYGAVYFADGVTGSSLRLDNPPLDADGTYRGGLVPSPGNVMYVPRRIITLANSLDMVQPGEVQTIDGSNVFNRLTTIGPYGSTLPLPADVTPQGGTFTIKPVADDSRRTLLLATGAPVTVHGRFRNDGLLLNRADLITNAFTSTGRLTLDSGSALTTGALACSGSTTVADGVTITATTASLNPGLVTFTGESDVTTTNGLRVNATVTGTNSPNSPTHVHFGGDVTMAAGAQLNTSFYGYDEAPAFYDVSGSFHAAGTLDLDTRIQPRLGETVVLVEAGAITGRFATIDHPNVGRNHWAISYTGTQIVATFAAGNV